MDKDLLKLLARLTALKNNLPKWPIPKKYGDEFNLILDELGRISGENLGEFKLPASEIKPRVTSSNYLTGQVTYSSESFCDKDFLLMKIDGVLGYFTLSLQPTKTVNQIGFHVETNEKL